MATELLTVEDAVVSFDGFHALDHLDFSLREGELRFLIGPNGAGKTTLLDMLTGKVRPVSGRVRFNGDIDITRHQEHELVAGMTKREREMTRELLHTLEASHTIIVTEHDMDVVRRFSRTVTVMHLGKVIAEGSVDDVQNNPEVVEVYLGRARTQAA